VNIAIIGAGNVGGALGKSWARAGHRIIYGIKDPQDPKHALAARAAGNATLASVAEAVRGAEVIVLAVNWTAVPDAIAACGDLTGRVVIDVTNPLTFANGALSLALGFETSGGETVASIAKGAHVFKSLNQIGYAVMADTSGFPIAPTMFVAGEDGANKAIVMGLVGDLGFEPMDAGPLSVSRLLEPYAMLWIHMVLAKGAPQDGAFGLMRKLTKDSAMDA